ncbi:tetratricopeptide repeat protein [Leifsonia sp. A12D58]|uniref:tetratricopeptide repeat protein n=1 Tax=Leifsonia sp. A12D58 TaxID=3397674 RepID=UPI0039E16680
MDDGTSLDQSQLDSLWDFGDPAASAERFRAAADEADNEVVKAEYLTQLARALGASEEFDDAVAVLDDAAEGLPSPSALVDARIALEQARLLVARDLPHEAVPFLLTAVRKASAAGSAFIALDALHMLALVDTGHEEEWAHEGIDALDSVADPRTRRWGVAFHNNLGWRLLYAGNPDAALDHFESALHIAETVGTENQRFVARWAKAKCLRALGRTDEAIAIQRELAAERPAEASVAVELAEMTGASPTIKE